MRPVSASLGWSKCTKLPPHVASKPFSSLANSCCFTWTDSRKLCRRYEARERLSWPTVWVTVHCITRGCWPVLFLLPIFFLWMSALYSEMLFQFSEMCAFHFSFVHLYTLYKYNWYKHQVAQITNNKKEAVSPIVDHVDHSYLYLQSKARALCCILKSIGCCVLLISCFGGAGAVRAYVDWCRMRAWCLEQKWAAHVSGVQRSGVALLLGRFIHCRVAARAATKKAATRMEAISSAVSVAATLWLRPSLREAEARGVNMQD